MSLPFFLEKISTPSSAPATASALDVDIQAPPFFYDLSSIYQSVKYSDRALTFLRGLGLSGAIYIFQSRAGTAMVNHRWDHCFHAISQALFEDPTPFLQYFIHIYTLIICTAFVLLLAKVYFGLLVEPIWSSLLRPLLLWLLSATSVPPSNVVREADEERKRALDQALAEARERDGVWDGVELGRIDTVLVKADFWVREQALSSWRATPLALGISGALWTFAILSL